MPPTIDRDTLHDYVIVQGYGAPSEAAYAHAQELVASGCHDHIDEHGINYAGIAVSIVNSGMTVGADEEESE